MRSSDLRRPNRKRVSKAAEEDLIIEFHLSEEETMQDPIVGIDLGTTNSEVAIIRDGQPFVFEEDGDPILPSFVGLSEDGKLLVGKEARNQWVLAPERTVKSIKRKMGENIK